MRRRKTCAALVVTLAAIAAVMQPQEALAYDFRVTACNDAPDQVNNAWFPTVTDTATLATRPGCGEAGAYGGLAVYEQLGEGPRADAGDAAWWQLAAPTGARITALRIDRWARILGDEDWRPEIRAGSEIVETCHFPTGTDQCGFGHEGGGPARTFAGLSASALAVGGRCAPSGGATVCGRGVGMHAIEFVLYGATVTIDDQENPDFTAPHVVAASDGRWHNASAIDVTLPAAEDNTGIRERRAYLDGDLAHAWTAPGAAQGGCGELNAGVAYTFTQPCADGRGLNDAMATTLPVAAVPDGVHALHFEAVDTGGGSASSGSFTLRLDRLPPAVSVGTPGSLAGGQALAVDATYADSTSGVVRTEEEVRVDDGSWQPASGVVEPGRTYRFRARAYDAAGNVSAWVESGPVRVPEAGATEAPPNDAPALGGNSSVARPAPITAPSPGAGTPRPHTASRAPGKPRIRSATLRVGELRTRGTLPVAATGKVTVRFTARAGGRTRTVRRRVTIARGRWTVRITLRGRLRQAPRGTLTVRYAGNAAVAPGVTTRVVRTATRPRAA